MKIQAIVHAAEEGGFWAEVPALPGCFTQGESMDEIKANLMEAVEGWLETATDRAIHAAGAGSSLLELAI